MLEMEMTLNCELNGMVLGYRKCKSRVCVSDKRLQTLCKLKKKKKEILAVVLTDYPLLLV